MAHLSRREFARTALFAGAGTTVALPQGLRADADSAQKQTPVKIKTLGTGAADHDWRRLGEPGVRGSTSTLIDGHILIDCGATGFANLARAGVSPQAVTDLVITHSHSDHFDTAELLKVLDARAPGAPTFSVWAAPEPLATLNRKLPGRVQGHDLTPGMAFEIGRCRFTALPANHQVPDPAEQALHYLIETPCGNLLYALDGAWMLKKARQLIGKRHLHLIVWDATMSKSGDYRIFEHNDLAMIDLMMQSLETTGCADAQTVCVLDHVARTLWPVDLREAEKLAADRGWILAADGKEFELRTPAQG